MIALLLICIPILYIYYRIPPQYRTWEMIKATFKYYMKASNVTIDNTHSYKRITFMHNGDQYHITLPYNRGLLSKMSGKRVYLLMREDQAIDITHPVGIPYRWTAHELGGTGYKVVEEMMM